VSSSTEVGLNGMAGGVVANLREVLDGKLPASCLNPEAWSL
jgi:hypothetical protein